MLSYDELSEVEKRLWDQVASGSLVDLRVGDEEQDDPSKGWAWMQTRTVRAEVIVELLRRAEAPDGQRPRALLLAGARIVGRLDLGGVTLVCPMRLFGCSFAEAVSLDDARAPSVGLRTCHLPDLNARQLETRGNLDLTGARSGKVVLRNARVGGDLILTGAQLVNEEGPALNADRLHVEGSMFCDGFSARGEVGLLNARVSGVLVLKGAQLVNEEGSALSADGLHVEGSMFCDEGFSARGEVRLLDTRVSGVLVLKGAQLVNGEGPALNADRLHVEGSMFCDEGFSARGEVRLLNARVSGQLSLKGAQLVNEEGPALGADGLHVEGSLFCDGFSARGEVGLPSARVLHLNLQGAQLVNEDGCALMAARLRVMGAMRLPTERRPVGVVDLTNAEIGEFHDRWEHRPRGATPGERFRYRARLSGLSYASLGPFSGDLHARLDWLASADDDYLPGGYERLAGAFRRAGRVDDARRVAIAQQRRRRQHLNVAGRLWSYFLAASVGYGYRTWQAVLWLAAFVLVGWGVFEQAYPAKMEPTKDPAPSFHAWLYSLDAVLPVVGFGQEGAWSVQGSAMAWYVVSVIAGWVLVTAVIAALTASLFRD